MASQLCTPAFTESLQNCYQAKNSDKIFMVFLHSRPSFYVVRLYVMTKTKWQIPERMITSTICCDEPKLYLNLVNFDIEVYVTHNIKCIWVLM